MPLDAAAGEWLVVPWSLVVSDSHQRYHTLRSALNIVVKSAVKSLGETLKLYQSSDANQNVTM